jgi:hypothetical protein
MAHKLMKRRIQLSDHVGIDETDDILQWFRERNKTEVDLAKCLHLHSAILQILISAHPRIVAMPIDTGLHDWLNNSLNPYCGD